ncbi:unnamed protein product [Schistosoma curassoni]|uniref:Ovule protein n=1 Tax=Schistosoma curassoni TaxID=6186 RepID=A0A183JBQ5_9TREM|nr:unnamed protein product [Schistosoma curassoni]
MEDCVLNHISDNKCLEHLSFQTSSNISRPVNMSQQLIKKSKNQMVVGGSRQETLDPGFVLLDTRQQSVPVILRELMLPGGFDPVSPSFTVRDVTSELSGS